ncbi:MAG: FecR domain-containing protein [Tannerella sp.]|nr:FecR domain-containing protein [Tannerella sp.]
MNNFLQDDDFIFWRLTGDSDLETYWNRFIRENPALRPDFDRAIRLFADLRLNKSGLTDAETESLFQRIKASVAHRKRGHTLRLFVRYAAAACVALAVGFFVWRSIDSTRGSKDDLLANRLIVGENLQAEDIRLITDGSMAVFGKDVIVQVDESGTTTVREAGSERATVLETEAAKMNTLIVPYGKRSQLVLSDGTRVWLNSGSVLEFPAAFTGKSRIVNLVGEMYIEVAHDAAKPFLVQTDGFRVQVRGTKFNVSAYRDADVHSVVLVEGEVSVKNASHTETLKPNDMLTCGQNGWDKKVVDVSEYLSWKNGYIMLDHTPMNEVLRRLERYYNLSFNIGDDVSLASKTCNGKIYLSDNLDEVMEIFAFLSGTKYSRNGKTIYIKY